MRLNLEFDFGCCWRFDCFGVWIVSFLQMLIKNTLSICVERDGKLWIIPKSMWIKIPIEESEHVSHVYEHFHSVATEFQPSNFKPAFIKSIYHLLNIAFLLIFPFWSHFVYYFARTRTNSTKNHNCLSIFVEIACLMTTSYMQMLWFHWHNSFLPSFLFLFAPICGK